MADIQANMRKMVSVSILVILFINGNATTTTRPTVSELTSESMQPRQKDHPLIPSLCEYVQLCMESNCNPPKV